MNKANLKSYAPQARKDFIAAVTARANLLGLSEQGGQLEVAPSTTQGDVTVIAGQAWPAKVQGQRDKLIQRIHKLGFAQTMEAVAYTWFNRFAALRYMELHDYLGHGHRALSSIEGGLPDILTHAADLADVTNDGKLPGLSASLVAEMKLAGNRDGELYRMLLVAQCNALSIAMPFLFEHIDDETELLLPDNLLRTDSVVAKLVAAIDEDDWKEVEIIGWLYQFYISEKKDEVIGKVVKSEDIPAATQLFTPNWIVQYLVQNSVGRLWLMANPTSLLKSQWPYYIEPAEQTPEVQAQLDALIQTRMNEDGGSLNPETLTVLDPACGSGHILVVAYDVLKAIYLERGYQPRAIPRLILEKNLYGLDIDDRAAQLAGFALLMKARADDRRLFNDSIKLNVLALQESKGLNTDALTRALQTVAQPKTASHPANVLGDDDLFPGTLPQSSLGESIAAADTKNDPLRPVIAALIDTFVHAKTFGSLIQIPDVLTAHLRALPEVLTLAKRSGDMYATAAADDLLPLVQQAHVLAMQFDAVVANPPYIGRKAMNDQLKKLINERFIEGKSDAFGAFILRCLSLSKETSRLGLMTPFVWMFLSGYEELRLKVLGRSSISSLVHPQYHTFFESAAVPICVFVIDKSGLERVGKYFDLTKVYGAEIQPKRLLAAIQGLDTSYTHIHAVDDFLALPGAPVAYWAGESTIEAFKKGTKVGDLAAIRKGMATGDNNKYVRLWTEVSYQNVGRGLSREAASTSGKKWFPYANGGGFRKWYGSIEDVVLWENDGAVLQTEIGPSGVVRAVGLNLDFIFKEGIVWLPITSAAFSAKIIPAGCLFSSSSNGIFPFEQEPIDLIGQLNSSSFQHFSKIINPTLNLNTGDMAILPILSGCDHIDPIKRIAGNLVHVHREDWNRKELSLDFKLLDLIEIACQSGDLSNAWSVYEKSSFELIKQTVSGEEEINRIMAIAYKFENEVKLTVSADQITLARADREKDCQRLISYAIGCMMGRYSLDEPGLIYAHAGNVGFDASRYVKFPADADGIVPLTDDLWFGDDTASRVRDFLLAVWGAETLDENMAWLAESLGTKAGETPEETIRRYLASSFYKDHLQTYKKRPIYWLFSSGKQGAFQALVYLHRYHEGTLARMRAEYVVPLTGKLQSRIEMLQKDADAATSTAARNKLNKEAEKLKKKHVELLAYDEQLRHYADMRINLDLDDGVKVNYGKFGDLLAEVKAVTGGATDD